MVVTAKLPAMPGVKDAEAALVMAGAWPTTTVRAWVAFGMTPLLAVTVRSVVPVAVGVPERRAVPLPLSVKVSPAGNVPVSVMADVGEPVVTIAKEPVWFKVK